MRAPGFGVKNNLIRAINNQYVSVLIEFHITSIVSISFRRDLVLYYRRETKLSERIKVSNFATFIAL